MTRAAYEPLLSAPQTNDDATMWLLPDDAAKLVTRLRRVRMYLRSGAELVTHRDPEKGTYSTYGTLDISVPVSAEVMKQSLEAYHAFNERKRRAGKPIGQVRVTRRGSDLIIG